LKQWVVKLLQQLDINFSGEHEEHPDKSFSEEKATLLYIIDTYNKHLFEIEKHSIRKVREKLDNMAKSLVESSPQELEKTLFEIRQFFSSYRIDEYSYIQNTFDDFKRIVWDFADQLSEDIQFENSKEKQLGSHLKELKEAVEANSIESLRLKSREFINTYVEYQQQKNTLRERRIANTRKNLETVKKQLLEANNSLNVDHLTAAHNRKSFDEYLRKQVQMHKIDKAPLSIIMLDIDFFKKINDSYGHDIGDFVLKECVRTLKEVFHREDEMVARIGGEEFVVILPHHNIEHTAVRAEELQKRIRNEAFIQGSIDIRFTVSMGLAQMLTTENISEFLKRADLALYQSKNSGRNKYTVAGKLLKNTKAA
jgi:diguanylate cyclase (GGDEF)-like protein